MLRIDPVYQMLIFSAFLTLVFPVIGLVMFYRISCGDMGYFRWDWHSPQGAGLIVADLFATGLSIYVSVWLAWANLGSFFVQR